MKEELIKKLQEIVKELTKEDIQIEITRTKDSSHGDWSTNVALILGKKLGKNPRDMAEEIAGKFEEILKQVQNDSLGIEKVEVAGPGFINFYLSPDYLLQKAEKLQKEDWEFPNIGKEKPAIVEYSSPNIAKPFTIGHLRSTIIGDAVANLLEAVGYKVYRDNHLGDWGSQFGKQIYAIKNIPLHEYAEGTNVEDANEKALDTSDNPIKDLVTLYVKFHEMAEADPNLDDEGRKWFKKLEDGDQEARRLWQKCIDWTFKEFDRIYGELNVHFTENGGRGYGEAFFEGKMQPIIDELREKGLLKESKGAQLVFYPNDEFPPLMILKNDGATLYSTRDLATDKFRLEHYPGINLVINEVGAEQNLYWRQIYKLEEMLGWYKKGERVHIGHGMFRFKEGKMSTRKGNVIWLDDVLGEAVRRAGDIAMEQGINKVNDIKPEHIVGGQIVRDKITKQVAIGALKWNDLKRSSHLDIAFDWDEVLNMQGNSGPYIQYSYVRTKSILDKAGNKEGFWSSQNDGYKPNAEEMEVLRHLDKFAEIVEQAAVTYSANLLTQFLFELAQLFNNFYQKHRIVNAATEEEKEFRLALTQAVGNVLKKGLYLLGISSPEKM